MKKAEIIENLRNTAIKIREHSKKTNKKRKFNLSEIVKHEIRQGYLEDKIVERLVIFLTGSGCGNVIKNGGCTFCGFYNATNFNNKISDNNYLLQFKKTIANKGHYPIVSIYNDGSLLCNEEISFNILKKILSILEKMPSVKKVVLESKINDISEKKICEIRKIYSKSLEIAIGFESANAIVRDFCINKSFSQKSFKVCVDLSKRYDIDIIPLLILKPPFLSEQEAINDYIASLKYLEQFRLKRIDMEIATVQKGTIVHLLWQNNLFKPPWFWSVIEILKIKDSKNLKTPLYISPISYTVDSQCQPSNCVKCNHLILNKFNKYNLINKCSNLFDDIECDCKKNWKIEMQKKISIKSIPARIAFFLNSCDLSAYLK